MLSSSCPVLVCFSSRDVRRVVGRGSCRSWLSVDSSVVRFGVSGFWGSLWVGAVVIILIIGLGESRGLRVVRGSTIISECLGVSVMRKSRGRVVASSGSLSLSLLHYPLQAPCSVCGGRDRGPLSRVHEPPHLCVRCGIIAEYRVLGEKAARAAACASSAPVVAGDVGGEGAVERPGAAVRVGYWFVRYRPVRDEVTGLVRAYADPSYGVDG